MQPAAPFLLPSPLRATATPWPARLALGFERREQTTVLTRREHSGPLRVQKPLYPEGAGTCHVVVLHPPAGIAGGDELSMDFRVGDQAHAVLTTPGAGKWYRSAGMQASQALRLQVGAGGTAEWLPQESIVFDGALADMRTHVELASGARYLGLETLCFGRRASGERFRHGQLRLGTDISLGGKLIWRERGVIDGGSALLDSPIGLAGRSVCSTLLVAGVTIAGEALSQARAVTPVESGARCGVSALPQLFVGRYLGDSAEAARAWFVDLWAVVRPALANMPARPPRIWAT